jgi:cell division protease FtsH
VTIVTKQLVPIDNEVSDILSKAYERAKRILTEHRDKLLTLAHTLLEVETVDREQFEALMAAA